MSLLGMPQQNPPKLGDLNNRNLLFPSSEGLESEIEMLAGLVPSAGCEGGICSRPLLVWQTAVFSLHLFTSPSLHVRLSLCQSCLFV